ncbi:LacI family DNA-binding transcriptional regulator [Paenibacillus sp. y28]|uniref:LacI family DNA-binding transcriptional regulator n=1 Tax=Paenibacillus sp. y28 TaxID=3129110 RepID=UPI00301A091C
MVTIYDIARQAGVSAMTVSRVINNTGRISDSTRRRVKAVMDELGYIPNSAARSLVVQETKILSLLITDITNPFYTTLARGAEDAAKRSGYRLLFSNSDEDLNKEREYIDMVLQARVDGVVLAPSGDASLEHLHKLRQHRIPFVLLDREVPGAESDMVLGDSREGARKLVEYLISLGHHRIAFVNGLSSTSTARHRKQGYADALKLGDLPYMDDLYMEIGYRRLDEQTALAAAERLLSGPVRPTAIFAANNFLALALIRALNRLGVAVPEQMSVVCFDDLDPAALIDPFLTVAAQPAYQFGELGIQLLLDRIAGEGPDQSAAPWKKIILPCEIIARRSAAPLP